LKKNGVEKVGFILFGGSHLAASRKIAQRLRQGRADALADANRGGYRGRLCRSHAPRINLLLHHIPKGVVRRSRLTASQAAGGIGIKPVVQTARPLQAVDPLSLAC
jgi:hypothetical protein